MDPRPEIEIELLDAKAPNSAEGVAPPTRAFRPTVAWVGLLGVVALVGLLLLTGSGSQLEPGPDSSPGTQPGPGLIRPGPADLSTLTMSPSLLAAERFVADQSRDHLESLIDSIGGLAAAPLAFATGPFDMVGFDPADHDRLLATMRSSYGPAENQSVNQLWTVVGDEVRQTQWAPDTPHDFAHFNVDGTITMWTRGSDAADFAPRIAAVLDGDAGLVTASAPVYASRFTVAGGVVFALTGSGEYSPRDEVYDELIADDGISRTVLDAGSQFGWIDTPTPEILVAFPVDSGGSTAVWDTASLRSLPDHPLAGRPYRRLAVSGDGRTALGVLTDGRMQTLDLASGRVESTFGFVDVEGINEAVALNADATIALTVERTGDVSVWWVGDDQPVAVVEGEAAQPRWVAANYSPRSASVLAPDASRAFIRRPATGRLPVGWLLIDTTIGGWIERACASPSRPLSPTERNAQGLGPGPLICPSTR